MPCGCGRVPPLQSEAEEGEFIDALLLPSHADAVPGVDKAVGAEAQGKCPLLHPAAPYYPFPRGRSHTRGNI